MRSHFKVFLCPLLVCGLARVGLAQPSFDLSWDAPALVEGAPGSTVAIEAVGRMTPGGELQGEGAQGWSISFSGDGCTITNATTAGTAGADVNDDPPGLRDTGFEVTQLTTDARPGSGCEGRDGGVSAVVLSFIMPITLPPDQPSDIVRASFEATVPPAGCVVCDIEYVDGCRGGGQPVDNVVTHMGQSVLPTLGSTSIEVCAAAQCDCDDIEQRLDRLERSVRKLQRHTHEYLTGRGQGHNNQATETGPPQQ